MKQWYTNFNTLRFHCQFTSLWCLLLHIFGAQFDHLVNFLMREHELSLANTSDRCLGWYVIMASGLHNGFLPALLGLPILLFPAADTPEQIWGALLPPTRGKAGARVLKWAPIAYFEGPLPACCRLPSLSMPPGHGNQNQDNGNNTSSMPTTPKCPTLGSTALPFKGFINNINYIRNWGLEQLRKTAQSCLQPEMWWGKENKGALYVPDKSSMAH